MIGMAEWILLGCSAAALIVAGISIVLVKRRLVRLAERRQPFGWKYLAHEGPRLAERLGEAVLRELHLDRPGLQLILYHFDCAKCSYLQASLPSLLEDFPDLFVTMLSPGPTKLSPMRHERVRYVQNQTLSKQLSFYVAPYAVTLQSGIPERKGIVNSLEQLRLIVDPQQVFLDVRLS